MSVVRAPVVFISYKWEDERHNAWVERLAFDLRSRGVDALLDRWEVGLGESFSDYMTSAIARSDAVLFVITSEAVRLITTSESGGALRFEVQLATARKIKGDAFRFIGILREGHKPPFHLVDARYADFRDDHRYSYELAMLVSDLKGQREKPKLPEKLEPELIAEPAIHYLWRILPHGGNFLISTSVSPELQVSIRDGICKLIEQEATTRSYAIVALDLDLDKCSPQALDTFFCSELMELSLGNVGKGMFPKFNAPVEMVCVCPASIPRGAVALFVRSVTEWGADTENLLHALRSGIQGAGLDLGGLRLTTIVMLADLQFVRSSPGSPWDNLYSLVSLA